VSKVSTSEILEITQPPPHTRENCPLDHENIPDCTCCGFGHLRIFN
jgi:hypothetical protein